MAKEKGKKLSRLLKEKKEDEEKGEIEEEVLDKIIDRMSEKYKEEGILNEEEAPERTKELRKLMRGERTYKLGSSSAKQLEAFDNPFIKFFGKIHVFLEKPLRKLEKVLEDKIGQSVEKDLVGARMKYSVEQYLALVLVGTIVATGIVFGVMTLFTLLGILSITLAIIFTIVTALVIPILAILIPKSKAKKIGNEVEKQLPFALRHMSIQIKAGVGIYETMESVAEADYGRLSEGFKWILANIEKGVSTEAALEAWTERTKNKSVRRVVSHIVRALRTGGSLSDVMVKIAEDISFQRRQRIADFAEKLNLMGLFLMMSAIVLPIMIAILTTVGSTPQLQQYLGFFSVFSPMFLMMVFFLIVPGLLMVFMFYLKASDPGSL